MTTTDSKTITESGKRKGVAVSKSEALDLLQSAIWHCQQNGIEVRYVNKPDALWLKVPEATLSAEGIRPIEAPVQEPAPALTISPPASP